MLRFILRKICLILVIFALISFLKRSTEPISDTVGAWISGVREHRILEAFGDMIESLSQGNGMKNSVEVFCEALQD